MARIGRAAAGVSGAALADGVGRLARGQGFRLSDLLLTPGNVGRVTDELARLRGAAMKIGQLVSMDAGGALPPELAGILARLRADAEPMPDAQLDRVLAANWGEGWRARLSEFDPAPIAAASIGQVHRAVSRDGRPLAIKVQYPGVRESINSDVDNVASLLRLTGLVPPAIDVKPFLAEAKRQLHEEADYRREAECLARFHTLLRDDPAFLVPEPEPDLSTADVLAMGFAESEPIESLETAPQAVRDAAATRLIELFLRELFLFGLMQTDPNFANYRVEPETGRLVLLDFGATRAFSSALREALRAVTQAGLGGDREGLRAALTAAGVLEPGFPRTFSAAVLVMVETGFKAIRHAPLFDFTDPTLGQELEAQGRALGEKREALRAPPVDILFVQRKIGGLALLAARLKARVPLHELAERFAHAAPVA